MLVMLRLLLWPRLGWLNYRSPLRFLLAFGIVAEQVARYSKVSGEW